jgi:hypothetical protein
MDQEAVDGSDRLERYRLQLVGEHAVTKHAIKECRSFKGTATVEAPGFFVF